MPPWWKIRRELVRPFRQLASLPLRFGSLVAGRWYYDTFLRKHKRIEYGSYPLSSKVCIYVVYPTTPECASQLVAIKSLREDGFSVLVVSNKYLDESLRQKILSFASVLIERVNFGYDFGAYREGVLYLYENKLDKDLSYLMLMNDSCWYPMSSVSWPALAMSLEKDFVGATSAYGISRRKLDSDPHKHWLINKAHRNFHYASYALMIGPKVLQEPRFKNFFLKLPLTNTKKFTVRRGEIGLTQLIKRLAASHGETHGIEALPRDLAHYNSDTLLNMVKNCTITNSDQLTLEKKMILTNAKSNYKNQDEQHLAFKSFLLRVVARQGLCYSLPTWSISMNHFQFLKKTLISMSRDHAQIVEPLIKSGPHDAKKEIQKEIFEACRLVMTSKP
jgi:hypothetical protein